MRLDKIKISGYKSVEDVELPIKRYGDYGSYTTIFLGKNETGKSNTLDAIAIPVAMNLGLSTDFLSTRTAQTESERISISYTYDIDDSDESLRIIDTIGDLEIPKEIIDNLQINSLTKIVYLKKGDSHFSYDVDISFSLQNLDIGKYCISKSQDYAWLNLSNGIDSIIIKRISEIEKDATNQYICLTTKKFKDILVSLIKRYDQLLPPVSYWSSNQDYLIHDGVDLRDFAETLSNIPLRNMFYLAGLKTQEEIRDKISDISNNHKELLRFSNKIADVTTTYINEKWSELPIKFHVDIDNNLVMYVYVKDDTDDYNVFSMDDRSQGFKQFISILLSLSIENTSGELKNQIILLDEPEVHLHPSGVRWLKKELIEIGKNNYLFVATHSVFMLDRETKERHFLFSKDSSGLTRVRQIQTDDDINSDENLSQAFGVNIMTDFISPYRLLVEGLTDKKIIQKTLDKVRNNHGVMISKGNGNNLPATLTYLDYYNVDAMVIVDDDSAGKEIKEKIIKRRRDGSKVFTIKELSSEIVSGGSIEDTLYIDYVVEKANHILNTYGVPLCNLNGNSPTITQLRRHLQKNIKGDNSNEDKKNKVEEIVEKIKIELSEYKEDEINEDNSPKLFKLAKGILEVLGIS